MSVMTSFTLRSLKKNRVRTVVSIIGIALSCALLTAVFTSVTSLQGGLLERTLATEGSWHVFLPDTSDEALEEFEASDNVADMSVYREIGSAFLSDRDSETMGRMLAVRTLPEAVKGTFAPDGTPLSLIPAISEGRMPESGDEIVLPDFCKDVAFGDGVPEAGVASDGALAVGGTLTLDLGTREADERSGGGSFTLNSSTYGYLSPDEGSYPSEERFVNASSRTYTVVGFYKRQTSFNGSDFTAAAPDTSIVALTAADAGAEGVVGTHFTVQGFSSAGDITRFVDGVVGEYRSFPSYHYNLYRYQGIDDGRPITGTLWMIAYVLAAVIIVASVSLIYNSFAISVADRTRQFGLLSSIGASKKQLRRSVLFEAGFLGLIGIPIGVLAGIAGVFGVFSITQEAFSALLGTDGGVPVVMEPVPLVVVVLLSAFTLLASAWIPARRAGRVSAVDAIRQTQDVKMSKRAARKAQAAGRRALERGKDAPAIASGLAGKLFGTPGFIAHRNLSRASARGRTVVASLAVSVALIVIAGSVALYLTPISDRAESLDGAGSGADLVVSGSAPEMAELSGFSSEIEAFIAQAQHSAGVQFLSSYRQGQAEAVIPADMISDGGRMVGDDIDAQRNGEMAPSSFADNGDYVGNVAIFYLDNGSWSKLVRELGLSEAEYTDPENPRAIALNRYQGILGNDSYADVKPFAATGTIDLYAIDNTIQDGAGAWTPLGLRESSNGLVAEYLDQTQQDGWVTVEKPLDEVSTMRSIEVGALADDVPASVVSGAASAQFPVVLLPESVAGNAVDAVSPNGQVGMFEYYWSNISFTAENHAEAAAALEELAKGSELMDFKVYDAAESARQSILIAQAVQLFIFCFSVIMLLIAVANVFNTLSNSIMLRTREFAMLKSAGMGDRAFARMLVYECASYAVRGLAIGLAAAVAVTFLFYKATSLSFTGLAFELPWLSVGLAVAVVLVVLALSVVFALHKSHASSVVEALRADAV